MSDLADRAAEADARWRLFSRFDRNAPVAPGGSGPLAGRWIGLKDNIAVAGRACTAGMAHRAGRMASTDAHVVALLRAAGAGLLPGLMMDEAALGGVTENPSFGRTDNPRAPGHSAGGSSGGSAAAVAAGLVDVALGTDTLGSIRIPAAWCGVVGLKPTAGLIGRSGIVPLAPGLDAVGPLAARVDLIWPVLAVLAGIDPDDPASRPAPEGWQSPRTASGLCVGLPRQMATVDIEPEVMQAFERAASALRAAGARTVEIDIAGWSPAGLRRDAFLLTECEGAVALASEMDTLSETVRRLLGYGARVPAGKLVQALAGMRASAAAWDRAFGMVDAVLTPTTPQRAIRAGDPAPENQADFTALANAAGLPALAVPVAMPGDALPASVMLTGPAWSERTLLALGAAIEGA